MARGRNRELTIRRWDNRALLWLVELRHPGIWVSIATKDVAVENAVAFREVVRIDVFPNDFVIDRDFQHASTVGLGDQRVAIRQALRCAFVTAVEARRVAAEIARMRRLIIPILIFIIFYSINKARFG